MPVSSIRHQNLSSIEEVVRRLEEEPTAAGDDAYRFAQLLRLCGRSKSLAHGSRVHAQILLRSCGRCSTFLANLVVQMYGRCGELSRAREAFDAIEEPNLFSWAILMAAYVLNGRDRAALRLFRAMDQQGIPAESATLVSAIGAIAGIGDLALARAIEVRVRGTVLDRTIVAGGARSDVIVETAMINMFSKCGAVIEALAVFDRIQDRNLVSWNAMIAAFAQNGHRREAMELYRRMEEEGIRADESTYPSVLGACQSLAEGRLIHARICSAGLELDVVVGSALVSMHGRFGALEAARDVFDRMEHKNVITWCAMISAYAQNGHPRQALDCFARMGKIKPNSVTFLAVLEACSLLGDLEIGRGVHGQIVEAGFDGEENVSNALINMYGKCGSWSDARVVFDAARRSSLRRNTVVSWNSMIEAYAQLGHANEAVEVFQEMRLDGTKPDQVTFLEMMFACSHAGLVEQGIFCFLSMVRDERLTPSGDHWRSLVDLLGRAGWIRGAEQVVKDMAGSADPVAWTTLIGSCMIHGRTDHGVCIAEGVLAGGNKAHVGAPYALISNIYSSKTPRLS
ncbi:pentatricopeptide repeat-containing protein At3g09040, mitochondrial-like [Selaginella moellendorffii]|uniref:pentatricopeptide repeat-containing protein At3g09040, mitochondrial-like n=1 Tax=Selaginella moellendorffii TaxID=88036 RepID=UPI000D1CE63C|nr:pentatricopeptide repeat-containing protein At3g09040, mitochondrial-like [Selaginella moellendorffii]|eukprot:XP_024520062.1 pentatricopeptide repeat-containing protein At3g09040, mitochondrial-like [Selaginella moellendorffii]